ncbi:Yip1 domain-containing protein [Solidesulfovibrio carbinoliphilus subsp. oakridgensis]|uniref:Yip1 domain-containing protein n=2 Tax=Solidesulfovibrio carbinoliphilus TaxID=345370 RepID=G7QAD0_9BACT|nr:Yip1 domain-containing protein [Solidesulfovibrio carbinoliphilus subsp. oakridgensis]
MRINCPQCGFFRELPDNKVPVTSTMATCPKCRHRFKFRPDRDPVSRPAPRDPAQQAAPAQPQDDGESSWRRSGKNPVRRDQKPPVAAHWDPAETRDLPPADEPVPARRQRTPAPADETEAAPAHTSRPPYDDTDRFEEAPARAPRAPYDEAGPLSDAPPAEPPRPGSRRNAPVPAARRPAPAAPPRDDTPEVPADDWREAGYRHFRDNVPVPEADEPDPSGQALRRDTDIPPAVAPVPGDEPVAGRRPAPAESRADDAEPAAPPRPADRAPQPRAAYRDDEPQVREAPSRDDVPEAPVAPDIPDRPQAPRAADTPDPAPRRSDGVRDIWARLQAMNDEPRRKPAPESKRFSPEDGPGGDETPREVVTDPIPWERLDAYGFFPGLFLTLKKILFTPMDFFGAMPEGRPKAKALVFNLLISEFLLVIDFLWSLFGLRVRLGGPAQSEGLGLMAHTPGLGFLVALLLVPLAISLGIYLDAWLTHLLLLLFRSAKKGFNETFRVMCYSAAPTVLSAVPVAGQILSPVILVWYMTLQAIGLKKVHEAAYTQTLAAIFIKWSLYLFLLLAMLQNFAPGH